MKKVLFLIHDLGPGGAEKVLINLINNMNYDEYKVTVMSLFDVGVNKQFISNKVEYLCCHKKMIPGNSRLMKLLSPKQLHKLYIKDKYDIEIAYLEGPCARIISGCPNKDTKLVSWIHIEQKTTKRAAVSFRSEKEAINCYSKFNRIISVSKDVEKDFRKCLDVENKYEVLYNTNETDRIIELSREPIDNDLMSDKQFNIIGVGKLLKSKGFDRLLRIVKRLCDDNYPVHLYVLGVGPEQNNLQDYIENHNMQHNATLLGYETNPYKYVSKADLFVCASFAEGFSTATTEALVVGTPVCTVEVSGMKEMLGENNEYGIVTKNDDNALYKGIKNLLDNPELLNHYKEQAKIRGKKFNKESTVKAVENMIDKVLKGE